MECVAVSKQQVEKPGLDQLVVQQSADYSSRARLLHRLWQTAKNYVKEAGLDTALLEYKAGAVVLTNAPFAGTVPICGIENGKVVPYF